MAPDAIVTTSPVHQIARARARFGHLLGALLLAAVAALPAAQEQLIERTVAIVGGTVITLSDVRTAAALGLVEISGPTALAEAATRLVERALMLHEVARFAPPEPPASEVEARLAAVTARAGSAAALADVLKEGGFTAARLAQWVRDDLRIAAYLTQRFTVAGLPSEADVAAYERDHAADLPPLAVGAALTAVARDRLIAERRARLVADWLADLRRRTEVVEFGVP